MTMIPKTLAAPILVLVLLQTVFAESPSSRLNRERLEVGRKIVEQADPLETILPYYTEDFEYFDPIIHVVGKEDMQVFLTEFLGTQSGFFTITENEITSRDIYMSNWVMGGTFLLDPTNPDSGFYYEAPGMSIVKFREKTTDVYYQRDYYSESDIMKEIQGLGQVVDIFRTMYLCAVDPVPPPPNVCQMPPPPPPP